MRRRKALPYWRRHLDHPSILLEFDAEQARALADEIRAVLNHEMPPGPKLDRLDLLEHRLRFDADYLRNAP